MVLFIHSSDQLKCGGEKTLSAKLGGGSLEGPFGSRWTHVDDYKCVGFFSERKMEAEFPASIICTWAEEAEGSKAGGDRLTGRREQGSYAEKAAWGAGTAANDLPLRTLW